MPIHKITKKELVRIAFDLFLKNGYHGTSMADIAELAGIFKGSIYHYFPSKLELMKQVLHSKESFAQMGSLIIAYNERIPAEDRFRRFLSSIDPVNLLQGSLMGNISLEMSAKDDGLRYVVKKYFGEWIAAVSSIYSAVLDNKEAERLSIATLEELQGAILLARVFKDSGILLRAKERILDRFKRLFQ